MVFTELDQEVPLHRRRSQFCVPITSNNLMLGEWRDTVETHRDDSDLRVTHIRGEHSTHLRPIRTRNLLRRRLESRGFIHRDRLSANRHNLQCLKPFINPSPPQLRLRRSSRNGRALRWFHRWKCSTGLICDSSHRKRWRFRAGHHPRSWGFWPIWFEQPSQSSGRV